MRFVSLLVLIIAVGCSAAVQTPATQPAASPPKATPIQPASSDPVAAMKEIISRAGRGTPHRAVAYDLRYDVKKTDSMISPYTAVVTFHDDYSMPPSICSSVAEARAGSQKSPITVRLAWQDDRWVVKSLSMNPYRGDETWTDDRMPADSSLHEWLGVFGGKP